MTGFFSTDERKPATSRGSSLNPFEKNIGKICLDIAACVAISSLWIYFLRSVPIPGLNKGGPSRGTFQVWFLASLGWYLYLERNPVRQSERPGWSHLAMLPFIVLAFWGVFNLLSFGVESNRYYGLFHLFLLNLMLGGYFLLFRPRGEFLYPMATRAGLVICSLLSVELAFRAGAWMTSGMANPVEAHHEQVSQIHYLKAVEKPRFHIQLDEVLGWRSTPDYSRVFKTKDGHGNPYTVDYSTNPEGFRAYGDISSHKTKILIIGDSFTQAAEVSDNQTYFAFLKEKLPVEIFAYGVGGYGTLQEYMILERYLERIDPDLFILQFCYNDFINSSPALERISLYNNTGLRRPYLDEQGQMYYELAKSCSWLREFANRHSMCLYSIFRMADQWALKGHKQIDSVIRDTGGDVPEFKRAVKITSLCLGKIKDFCGETPVLSFIVDGPGVFGRKWRSICSKNKIEHIPKVPLKLRQAKRRGECVHAADGGHWNKRGHRICADTIAKYLVSTGYIDPATAEEILAQQNSKSG